MPSALTPLARCDGARLQDNQSLARPSPRHASARRATDTTRIQTKALMPKAGRRRRRLALPARPHASHAGCPRPHTSESPSTQRPRGTPREMIGRSTKKPPPSAEDYARRDPGTWSSAAPAPQARRYGESRSAWEARRPKPGANANASVYVPHFMQENVQRIPGKPFELRVHVRMKNKDLVLVLQWQILMGMEF